MARIGNNTRLLDKQRQARLREKYQVKTEKHQDYKGMQGEGDVLGSEKREGRSEARDFLDRLGRKEE